MATPLKNENEIKIFILYLLDKIGYPLDYPSIGEIMLADGVVNFFEFAECFLALVEAGHVRGITLKQNENGQIIKKEIDDNVDPEEVVLYEVTESGKQVANVLQDNLMISVRERGYRSALRHLSFEKKGAVIDSSYTKNGNGYLVNCIIKDKAGVLLDAKVQAENEHQLNKMLTNFSEKPEVVYRGILAVLSGEVNYIIE